MNEGHEGPGGSHPVNRHQVRYPAGGGPSQDKGEQKHLMKKPSGEKPKKARSGGKRLDEFLGGGFPFRSCSVIQGPAFIGKDVLLAQFIAEGIRSGAPALIVLTDTTTSTFRKRIVEMDYKLEERERAGLISYIDCHSKSVGLMGKNPFAVYLNGVKDLNMLIGSMERFQHGYSKNFFYQRIVFDSLSTVLRSHGLNPTIDFMNAITTKTKAYNGIAIFDLAGGIHKTEEINAIEHSMDGSILMREEKDKTMLLVKGLPDIKSNQWVEYTFDDKGLDIKGAYSYSYIK